MLELIDKWGTLKWSNNSGHSFKIEIPFLEEEFNDYQSEKEIYPGV